MNKIRKCQRQWMLYRINCEKILSDFIEKTDKGIWTKELICDGFVMSYRDYVCNCKDLFKYKQIINKDKFILLSDYMEIENKRFDFNFEKKSSLNKLRKKLEKR